ncbi:MAG: CDP-glycerol glycerophosphotransferase family protein [Lachnospiraceae bacterium]|nr:CDP-glycerol glycerophosphotransferase family protein [Lachnospiraceae bacterium]
MRNLIKRITPNFMIRLYQAARYAGITALFFLARLWKIQPGLVAICNVWGYGDNTKYVTEELKKRLQANPKLHLVFITNHPEQVPVQPGLRALKTNTPAAIFALARAQVWVDNNRKEAYIYKRKGQYYIQLWHGGIPLKRIEGDCEKELGEKYIRRAKRDSTMTDLFVSNSSFCTEMYRRAFWATCEIAEWGSPRNDRFVQRARGQEGGIDRRESEYLLRQKDESQKTQKTVVYAPTYRANGKNEFPFDAKRLREVLTERFGGEWRILVRLHPLVAAGQQFAQIEGVEDISTAPDLYERLHEADALITDYSNTMFEVMLCGMPVFLYMPDYAEYQKERGVYFAAEQLPCPVATKAEECYEAIRTYTPEQYQEAQKRFFAEVGLAESGRAAEQVAERIVELTR